jgi:hypothetical protein
MDKKLSRILDDYVDMLAGADVDAWRRSLDVDVGVLAGFVLAVRESYDAAALQALYLRAAECEQRLRMNAQRRRGRLPELAFV